MKKNLLFLVAMIFILSSCFTKTEIEVSDETGSQDLTNTGSDFNIGGEDVGDSCYNGETCATPTEIVDIKDNGTLEKSGDYEFYLFGDNRQCEKFAYESGRCPTGGFKITGYDTDLEKFCAITGAEAIAGEDSCTYNGETKTLQEYYDDYINEYYNTLKLKKVGEYEMYVSADNRQCEKFAYESGKCPNGGFKITGYDTALERFCAITGAEAVAGKNTCTYNGETKTLKEYYDDYINEYYGK